MATMLAPQALSDALQVIYREAVRSPWICLNALRESDAIEGTSAAEDAAPVLVLGGFLSHPYYYAPFGRILGQRGYAVHYDEVFNAQPFKPHVVAIADRVQRMADTSGTPIRLVGHSLGGLQAAAVLIECPEAVSHVVTVASPIVGGTPWRPLQRLAERMLDVQGSETNALRAGVEPYARRITTISSPQDLVAPPGVCTIAGATNVVLSTVPRRDRSLASHIGVIFMQTVVEIVLAGLARSADARPRVTSYAAETPTRSAN
jgi:pimeloyl-ACP methyl ester carboxylesterase